jgi:hypothetical protein
MCEKFNGWANRETWALNLWLGNEEGAHGMTRERVAGALADIDRGGYPHWCDDAESQARYRTRAAGVAVHELWDELTDPAEGLMTAEGILAMVRDIGSEYRVDWDEIGAAWLEDVDES